MKICFNRQVGSNHYLFLFNKTILASYSSFLDDDIRVGRSHAGIDEERFTQILGGVKTSK